MRSNQDTTKPSVVGQIEFDPLPKRHRARGIEKQVNICYRSLLMMNAAVGVVWRQESEKTAYYERNPIPAAGFRAIYPLLPFGRKAQIRRDGEGGETTFLSGGP